MSETWIPRQVTHWKYLGRRKSGRPRRSLQEGMDKIMQERNFGDDMWTDREKWRAAIGRCVTLQTY